MHTEHLKQTIARKRKWRALMLLFPALTHWLTLRTFAPIPFKEVLYHLTNFELEFELYSAFYQQNRPHALFFIQGCFGHEGEIAAARALDIPVWEFQHGHIYPEHYGYNFHPTLKAIAHQMHFPSEIFLYGEYWKEALLKAGFFDASILHIMGNPNLHDKEPISLDIPKGLTPILLSSQPSTSALFREFLTRYLTLPNAKQYYWIISLHPRELRGAWETFIAHHDQMELSHLPTHTLLTSVKIQFTSTSSVLYEALFFQTTNYFLVHDLDLPKSTGFHPEIGTHIPFEYEGDFTVSPPIDASRYFSPFHPEHLREFAVSSLKHLP